MDKNLEYLVFDPIEWADECAQADAELQKRWETYHREKENQNDGD